MKRFVVLVIGTMALGCGDGGGLYIVEYKDAGSDVIDEETDRADGASEDAATQCQATVDASPFCDAGDGL
jgi:hypothetical protein